MKTLLTIFILCIAFSSCKDFNANDLTFNQDEWKKGDLRVRGRMTSSLITQKILLGKTRDEVITILGEGDEIYPSLVKYNIDLGSIFERRMQKYSLFVNLNNQTKQVTSVGVAD